MAVSLLPSFVLSCFLVAQHIDDCGTRFSNPIRGVLYIYIFFATIAKASPSRAIRSARLDSDCRGFLEKNAKVPGFIRGINRSRKRCVRRSETEKVRAR